MVKKFKALADDVSESLSDNSFGTAVKDSAQQIWLAGLGAFAKAQEEGSKAFDVLVKEGVALQKQSTQFTEAKVQEMSERFAAVTGDLSKTATGTWDKLEKVFEARVERSLNSLGVPTSKDLQALAERLDALNASVQALASGAATKKTATPKATKAAAPAPAKKAASKAAKKAAAA